MQNSPLAFVLLSLPDASLTSGGKTENGTFSLNCVTMLNPEAANKQQRDVYLVLQVNKTEIPLDPARIVTRSDTPAFRSYTFAGTEPEPTQILLRVMVPQQSSGVSAELADKLDTFESILEQYAVDFRRPSIGAAVSKQSAPDLPPRPSASTLGIAKGEKDFRGHLIMINEATGEIVGEIQDKMQIHEDPSMYAPGHNKDPVIIEVPEGKADANALQAFARLVPPDQQNWITRSASICSQAISMTTNLLVTTISSATDFYVSHSSPSPHYSSSSGSDPAGAGAKGSVQSVSGTPPPLPPRPRILAFLTSENTKKGLTAVHTVSGEAVKMSSRTLTAIDTMMRRAMGMKQRRTKYFSSPSTPSGVGGASLAAPPPYEAFERARTPSPQFPPEKGALPPRSPSPFAGPQTPVSVVLPHQPKLTSKERMLMSLDLVLATVDDSARKLLDAGPVAVGKVVAHKYGPEAAHVSQLLSGAARNVGLVYVDMSGMGRRALLRRAGKTFVKASVSNMSN